MKFSYNSNNRNSEEKILRHIVREAIVEGVFSKT
jgi:hypothetical protein